MDHSVGIANFSWPKYSASFKIKQYRISVGGDRRAVAVISANDIRAHIISLAVPLFYPWFSNFPAKFQYKNYLIFIFTMHVTSTQNFVKIGSAAYSWRGNKKTEGRWHSVNFRVMTFVWCDWSKVWCDNTRFWNRLVQNNNKDWQ